MSIDVFDVVYCKAEKCTIAAKCGRCFDRFKEFMEKQQEAIPVTNIITMDFSVDLSGANLTSSCFLDPSEVRV
jgi:cytidine deaminase